MSLFATFRCKSAAPFAEFFFIYSIVLSDKRRQNIQTGADVLPFRVGETCHRSARRVWHLFPVIVNQQREQNYKSDSATSFGQPVDDLPWRALLLFGEPEQAAHLHPPRAGDCRNRE